MKKIKIKGNDYVMAHERVMEFHRLYANGSIVTEIIEMTERFITITKVTPDVGNPERCFTGIAYEDVTGSGVNSTSALENCETSSVARSLGFLNIGIDTSIASAEEVQNAIKQQKDKPKTKPPVNLKDVEVPNPAYDAAVKDLGGIPLGDNETDDDFTGNEIIRFGKYVDVKWCDVIDENYLTWLATKSKVEWQRELAQKELNRRSK